MAAGSIVVDLLLKTGSFETDTARASKALKQFQRDAEAAGKAIGLAFVAGVTGLTYLVKSAIDAADHLNDLSKKTGVSVETLGGLGFAASQAGGSLDGMADGLGKLNKSIAEAAAGNKEAQEAFKALGIDVRDSNGQIKDAGKVYLEVADRFATFADGPNKAALALKLFGKAGADQIAILDDGGAAIQRNIDYYNKFGGVTTETAQKADEFNDTLGQIKLLSGAFARTLAAELLPSLQALAALWLDNKQNGDQFRGVASDIVSVLKAVATAAAYVSSSFAVTGDQLGALAARAAALGKLDFKGFSNIGKDADENLIAARKRFEELVKAINDPKAQAAAAVLDYSNEGRNAPAKRQAPSLPASAGGQKTKVRDDYADLIKTISEKIALDRAELESVTDLTEGQKLQAKVFDEIDSGRKKLSLAQKLSIDERLQELLAIEAQNKARADEAKYLKEAGDENVRFLQSIRDRRDALEADAQTARDELAQFGLNREQIEQLTIARILDTAALKERRAALSDEIDTDIADTYRDQAKALREQAVARQQLLNKGLALQEDPLAGATQAVKDYLAEIKRAGDDTRRVTTDAIKGLEDVLVTGLSGGDLKSAAKSLVNNLIAEFYRLAVVKPLLASIFGGSGGGGLGSLLNSFNFGTSGNNYNGSSGLNTAPNYTNGADIGFSLAKSRAPQSGKQGLTVNVSNNVGAEVSTSVDEQGQLQIVIDRAVKQARAEVSRGIATGTGPEARALKSRGVSLAGGLPKRG